MKRASTQFAMAIFTVALLSGFTFGQSFNIDAGPGGAVPASTYGGGAGQAGFWNEVDANVTGFALMDLSGASTGVTVSDASFSNFAFNNASTSGDDQALLDDIWNGAGVALVFGLMPGNYSVYTYAWGPDNPLFETNVSVLNSSDLTQSCSGIWPGMHEQGVTFTVHSVTIDAQNPNLQISRVPTFPAAASCNGVQIVFEGTGSVGTPICDPANDNCLLRPTKLTANFGSGVGSDLHLTVTDGPSMEMGYFLVSAGMSEPGVLLSRGTFCLLDGTNPFARYNASGGPSDSMGQFSLDGSTFNNLVGTGTSAGNTGFDVPAATPLNGSPALAGGTWYFQLWHRDSACDAAGASNFSNALGVTFL